MLTTLAVTRPILLYVVELRRVRLWASLNMDVRLLRAGSFALRRESARPDPSLRE